MNCIGTCISEYVAAILLGLFAGSVLNWRIYEVLVRLRDEDQKGRGSGSVDMSRISVLRAPGRYWNLKMHRRAKIMSHKQATYGSYSPPSDISSLMQVAVEALQPHARKGLRPLGRYAVVELVTALSFAMVLYVYGWSAKGLTAMGLMTVFIAVAYIDLEERIIPDGITVTGLLFGLLLGPLVFDLSILDTLTGVVLGGGLFYIIAMLSRGGMGGGDIKFIAMTGAFVGWKGVLIAIFIGSVTGAVVGIGLMIFKGMGRKTPIPFGPFLVLGAVVALLYGPEISAWYACCTMP